MGEEPCKADCAIFGLLSQMYWLSFGGENERAIKGTHSLHMYHQSLVKWYVVKEINIST